MWGIKDKVETRLTLRMGKKNAPAITDKFVKVDGTRCSICIKIWSNASETKAESNDHS